MKRRDSIATRSNVVGSVLAILGVFSSAAPTFAAAPGTQGGPQYGYCSASTVNPKNVYVSAVFEMQAADPAARTTRRGTLVEMLQASEFAGS